MRAHSFSVRALSGLTQKPPVLTLQSYGFTTDSIIGIFLPLYNRVMISNGQIHYDETKTKGLRVMVNYYDETKKKDHG